MRESARLHTTIASVAIALTVVSLFPLTRAATAAGGGPVLSGRARVLDGDTLDIAGQRIRLEGIDAPETGQSCAKAPAGDWACGMAATHHLENLVAGEDVSCDAVGYDKYGRTLGICRAAGVELNDAMVRSGHAWAFVRYSDRYVTAEAEARTAAAGIWQKATEPAWDFRNKRWASAEPDAPGGCAIKGNVSRKGMLYHMPWSPWYGRVKIDETKGERWFCTEKEAIDAGFRPAAVN